MMKLRLHGSMFAFALALGVAHQPVRAQSPGGKKAPKIISVARQMVVVTTPHWDSTAGTLQRFERANTRSKWRAVGVAYPIVVGRTGLAWGVGLEGDGPHKYEGDGRSPAGYFPVGP